MLHNMDIQKIIMLESLLERGIQTKDNFETSFLSDIYTQALTMVESICKANSKQNQERSERLSSQKFKEIQNVIAFTGRRGTGKSSAMLTLTNHLCRNNTIRCIGSVDDSPVLRSIGFYHLTYFSAATIDENEDVFQIVLSKLFEKLDDFGVKNKYDDTIQIKIDKLKETICKVYDRYLSLKGSESLNVQSSYNLMDRLSQKYNVREEFKKLISSYTDLLNEISNKEYKSNSVYHSHYIIICIDDIDMAPMPMRIMQCINQNLMANNLIVMISYSQKFISLSLTKYFYEIIHCNPINSKSDYSTSKSQSDQFQEKIIPSDMIVTLPSWKKKDYQELSPIMIRLESKDEKTINGNFPRLEQSILLEKFREKNNMEISPKHVILLLVADRTKIYLDVFGNKFHFMEPDSLRNLYDVFYLLYSMDNIVKDEKTKNNDGSRYYNNRISNRKILLDFLNFRLRSKFDFDQEEEGLIDRFLAEPIERRGEIIWNHYVSDSRLHMFARENYSLGELYRFLYHASRLGIIRRNLIKFILASFSFTIPSFVENEKWKNKVNETDSNRYRGMRNLFQYSLLGKWREDIFNISQHPTTNFDETFKGKFEDIGKTEPKTEPMIKLDIDGVVKSFIKENNKKLLDDFIKDLIYHLFLSSRSTREPFSVAEFVSRNPRIYGAEHYYMIDGQIDPTAFIMNTLRLYQRFENMKFKFNNHIYLTTNNANTNRDCQDWVYSISYLLTELFVINNENLDSNTHTFFSSISGMFDELYESNPIIDQFNKFEKVLHNSIISDSGLSFSYLQNIITKNIGLEINTSLFMFILHSKIVHREKEEYIKGVLKALLVINCHFKLTLNQIYKCEILNENAHGHKNDVMFMLKHTDISYNVIKRSVSKMIYKSDNNLNKKRTPTGTYYEIINRFYDNVKHYLKEEDEIYFIGGQDNPESFYSFFSSHFVVKYFHECAKDNILNNPLRYCSIESNNSSKYVEKTTWEFRELIELIKASDDDNEDIYNKDIFESCVSDIRNMLDNGSEGDN